jgi:hypothetical protein
MRGVWPILAASVFALAPACKNPRAAMISEQAVRQAGGFGPPWRAAAGLSKNGLELWTDGLQRYPTGYVQKVQLQATAGTQGELDDDALKAEAFLPLEEPGTTPEFALVVATATGETCTTETVRWTGAPVDVTCRTTTAAEAAAADLEANRRVCEALARTTHGVTVGTYRCECGGQGIDYDTARYVGHAELFEADCREQSGAVTP